MTSLAFMAAETNPGSPGEGIEWDSFSMEVKQISGSIDLRWRHTSP
jgi:hypothetical protein